MSGQTPKNLVLCFDGTGNEFGVNNTNIVRLIQVLDRAEQRFYYDPGIGTLADPNRRGRLKQDALMVLDLATAYSLTSKVEAAYRFLMEYWERGAKVYLFGFSRGAYTARVLAGMLHAMGLLSRGNHSLVPFATKLFQSIRGKGKRERTYKELCDKFRQTFAKRTDIAERHFSVHFMGLFDTVSSVGWAWEPLSYPYTATNPSVHNVRHAISIDERRAFFRQNRLIPDPANHNHDWRDVWFPGVHSDVGGGYSEKGGALWQVALKWMAEEAKRFGLLVDDSLLSGICNAADPWAGPPHESLRRWWWLAEYYPKQHYNASDGRTTYRLNKGRCRRIKPGELIHQSALRRIRSCDYRPRNFSDAFIEKIKKLVELPEYLPFEP